MRLQTCSNQPIPSADITSFDNRTPKAAMGKPKVSLFLNGVLATLMITTGIMVMFSVWTLQPLGQVVSKTSESSLLTKPQQEQQIVESMDKPQQQQVVESVDKQQQQQQAAVKEVPASAAVSSNRTKYISRGNGTQFEILWIPILSMQRSSSTHLLFDVLTKNKPCVVGLNEIFIKQKQQSGKAWRIEGKEILEINSTKQAKDLPPAVLKDFLYRVAQRKCSKGGKNRPKCHGKCVVSYKEFNDQLTPYQHKWLWNRMPNTVPVVLERSIENRWKSTWLAYTSGDWNAHGSPEHKAKLEAARIPPMNYSKSKELCKNRTIWKMCDFQDKHEDWYNLIRSTIPSRVEVTYNESVAENGAKALDKIVKALPNTWRDWWIYDQKN